MGKFITYTVLGTLITFGILLHFSLLPHLEQLPAFAAGITPEAVLSELSAFGLTLALSWIAWWSVSGTLSLLLCSLGKYTTLALFFLSAGIVLGITILIA